MATDWNAIGQSFGRRLADGIAKPFGGVIRTAFAAAFGVCRDCGEPLAGSSPSKICADCHAARVLAGLGGDQDGDA